MDIFRLTDNGVNTYESGPIISGLTNKLWVERFTESGEFKFSGPATFDLLEALPIGALISHINTKTIMMVEDWEIVEKKGEDSVITFTGRSLDAFLNYRVLTDDDQGFDDTMNDHRASPHILPTARPWDQVVTVIRRQTVTGFAIRDSFEIPWFEVTDTVPVIPKIDHPDWYSTDDVEAKRENLYTGVRKLLSEFDGGIKILRPVPGVEPNIKFVIHMGEERQNDVQFSHVNGDIETARYYWSDRAKENFAYVAAQYQGKIVVKTGYSLASGFDRRVFRIDAGDININPAEAGWAGFAEAEKLDKIMKRRGKIQLRKATRRKIFEATISRYNSYVFRKDYDVGDMVFVRGNYGVTEVMRVNEFAETEDESGESGFPTLGEVDPDSTA